MAVVPVAPVALIADGREIARFADSSFEFPWFTATPQDLSNKHRDWLADVTRFYAEMYAAEEDGTLDDAAEDALWHRRLAELNLKVGDLDIFSQLSVTYSDGSIHRIGPTYFEDGALRWRNGEELTGEAAEFDPRMTHTRAFFDFCKGMFEQALFHLIFFAIVIAAFGVWIGWFG